MRKQPGFTFIELLVVTTLVLVLSGLGAVSYQAAQRKGRDAKRRSDLEQIRAALEMYRSDTGSYPSGNYSAMISTLDSGGYLNSADLGDPQGYSYYYNSSSGYSYRLCAYLETASSSNCSGNPSCGSQTCNYQVTNP